MGIYTFIKLASNLWTYKQMMIWLFAHRHKFYGIFHDLLKYTMRLYNRATVKHFIEYKREYVF